MLVKNKPVTIKHDKTWAKYSLLAPPIIQGPNIPLPNYKQLDIHSCGFIAALTVARYLEHKMPLDVMKVAKHTEKWGLSNGGMVRTLKTLGVNVSIRNTLTVGKLIWLVKNGLPVILSVWPTNWNVDHWCVVRGFSKNGNTIYLSNYKRDSIETFESEWHEHGEGIICS